MKDIMIIVMVTINVIVALIAYYRGDKPTANWFLLWAIFIIAGGK